MAPAVERFGRRNGTGNGCESAGERIGDMEYAGFFADRAKRGSLPRTLEILAKAGSDVPEEEIVRDILFS